MTMNIMEKFINDDQQNDEIKQQNEQLATQNDKLRQLCHLCLQVIVTGEMPSSSSSAASTKSNLSSTCLSCSSSIAGTPRTSFSSVGEGESILTKARYDCDETENIDVRREEEIAQQLQNNKSLSHVQGVEQKEDRRRPKKKQEKCDQTIDHEIELVIHEYLLHDDEPSSLVDKDENVKKLHPKTENERSGRKQNHGSKHFNQLFTRLMAVVALKKKKNNSKSKSKTKNIGEKISTSLDEPSIEDSESFTSSSSSSSSSSPSFHKRSLISRIVRKQSKKFTPNSANDSCDQSSPPSPSIVTITAANSMLSLANSATAAANHTRVCDSNAQISTLFENNEANQLIISHDANLHVANGNGGDEATRQNSAFLAVSSTTMTTALNGDAHDFAMSRARSIMNTSADSSIKFAANEKHSGEFLLTEQALVQEYIVDTSPKLSEIAMFCSLNENDRSPNQILNYAVRKVNEKRQQDGKSGRPKRLVNVKAATLKEGDEKEGKSENDEDETDDQYYANSGPQSLPVSKSFKLAAERFALDADIEVKNGDSQKSSGDEDEDAIGYETASNGTADSGQVFDDEPIDMTFENVEQEMDRLLRHLHQHRWFVFPADANANIEIVAQLETSIFDLNNIELAFQTIHRLWLERRPTIERVPFFYAMFWFLLQKYVSVRFCACHQPPCAPNVESSQFGKLAVPIVKHFLKCINPSSHMVIQMELLTALESLVYNRPHYRPALPEIFHQLFTNGVVECVTFMQWASLADPSPHYEKHAEREKRSSISSKDSSPPASNSSSNSSNGCLRKNRSKASICGDTVSAFTVSSTHATNNGAASRRNSDDGTTRERLFRELNKAGFRLFRSKI